MSEIALFSILCPICTVLIVGHFFRTAVKGAGALHDPMQQGPQSAIKMSMCRLDGMGNFDRNRGVSYRHCTNISSYHSTVSC